MKGLIPIISDVTQEGLLIHSMSNFFPAVVGIIDALKPRKICEIGVEYGNLTALLVEYSETTRCQYVGIDTKLNEDFAAINESDHVAFFKGSSESFLRDQDDVDVCFIDGDHNYHTVTRELELFFSGKDSDDKFVIFAHDVCWPWARRDLYYSPHDLPEAALHPYVSNQGVTLDNPDVISGGFRGEGVWSCAEREGGPRNGVLTAIEDIVGDSRFDRLKLSYFVVPAVFGMAVIFPAAAMDDKLIGASLKKVISGLEIFSTLLSTLERNRLELYLKVIEMQDREQI